MLDMDLASLQTCAAVSTSGQTSHRPTRDPVTHHHGLLWDPNLHQHTQWQGQALCQGWVTRSNMATNACTLLNSNKLFEFANKQ